MAGLLTDFLNQSEYGKKLSAEEDLIVAVTEQIWDLMEEKSISKADLAKKMEKSRAFLTQVLSGSRNMTLRTLADIAFALGENVTISFNNSTQNKVKVTDGWQKVEGITVNTGNVLKFRSASVHEAANSKDWYPLKQIKV